MEEQTWVLLPLTMTWLWSEFGVVNFLRERRSPAAV